METKQQTESRITAAYLREAAHWPSVFTGIIEINKIRTPNVSIRMHDSNQGIVLCYEPTKQTAFMPLSMVRLLVYTNEVRS